MHSRSTRWVFLVTALLCCCVAALAVAGMAGEPNKKTETAARVLTAADLNAGGWAETPQQPATDLEKKKTYQVAAPIGEEPEVDARTLVLNEKGDIASREDIAPMAVDSAAQGLRPEAEPNGSAAT